VGSQLWRILNTGAFAAVAAIYVVAAAMLFTGAAHSRSYGSSAAIAGFFRALREPELRRLAPVWLCVNSIVGLWLGPTLAFLMTHSSPGSQFLAGIFADRPEKVGWLLLWYSLVFGIGVSAWSVVLPRMRPERALRIGLTAMPFVCVGLMALNHSGAVSTDWRWVMGVVTALLIMIESGFTPAALSLLAGAVGARSGRGAAMGIYSVLLSVGAIAGSLMAAFLGKLFLVDGLIYGTFGLAILALVLMRALHER
jgi:predicted MFS family arabinose efflux permease